MYKTGATCPSCTDTRASKTVQYWSMYKTGVPYPGCTQTSEHPKQYSILQFTKKWFFNEDLEFLILQFLRHKQNFFISIVVEKRATYQKLSTGWNLLRGYIEQGRTWRTTTHHVVNVAMPEKKIESVTSLKPEPFFTTKIIKQLSSF